MYTKEDLIQCLKSMGLKPTDALMVHSSMKSIGSVAGDAYKKHIYPQRG